MSRREFCTLLLTLLLFCGVGSSYGQTKKTDSAASKFNVHTDMVYGSDKNLFQDYYIISPAKTTAAIAIKCYFFKTEKDSILVYRNTSSSRPLKKGLNTVKVKFEGDADKNYVLPSFAAAIKKTGIIPPGTYRLQVILHHDEVDEPKTFIHVVDSALSMESSVRSGLNNVLMPLRSNFLGQTIKTPSSLDKASSAFEHNKYRMAKYFKKKGLIPNQYTENGKEIIDLYYDSWFMGRYAMDSKASVSSEITKEQNSLQNNAGSMTHNELANYQSLVSQFRQLKKESRDKDEIVGQIALSANASTGQEPNSGQDNNYYEATGSVALPLFNIPFNITGYYTSQDQHREAKSSYVHFAYDVDKAKEQLMKLVGSYNKKYSQTVSQNGNYQMIYGQYIDQLKQQQATEIAALKKQAGISDFNASTFNPDMLKGKATQMAATAKSKAMDSVTNVANAEKNNLKDSLATDSTKTGGEAVKASKEAMVKAEAEKQKAEQDYQKAMAEYAKIMALEQKIEKYKTLLGQYKNTMYYDSLMNSSKLGNLKDDQNMSYKDMAKKASGILPDGKVKNVVTGLTNFDAGMFPKYVSSYTMSGQMLKGLDIGYDVGIANIGGSYGKTQYIDADGGVEDYKVYSLRAQFKPVLHQQFGLVYMGYSPSSSLLQSPSFLKDVDVSVPSFKKPVSIVSATYTGALGKYAALTGEYAISNQSGQPEAAAVATSFSGKSAYNVKLIGSIPTTTINLEAGYEHTGSAFTNNTLPVIMAGTEKVDLGAKGDFFRSFLSLGITYDYLLQKSFYTKGNNSRWGFDVATHSKRYPSVALSYKPFSTFQSYSDTLSIPQKPIVGEVWTGKASYQIKKLDKAIRFMLMYNHNNSIMDTVNYSSSLLQVSTIFSRKTTMLSFTIGRSIINTGTIPVADSSFNHSQFIDIAASGNITKSIMLSGGTDAAASKVELSRYGAFAGVTYTFAKLPLMLRANMRYSNYRPGAVSGWTPLFFGGIELAWKFKLKMWD
jgi:hypothetical protein